MKAIILRVFKKKKSLVWLLRECGKIRLQLILLVLLSIAATLCGVVLVVSSKAVIDTAISEESGGLLMKCLTMAAIIVLNLSLQALTNMLSTRTTIRFEAQLKETLFEKVLRKEWLSATRFHSGDLMTRFTSDISIVAAALQSYTGRFLAFTQLVAASVCSLSSTHLASLPSS